MRPVRLAEDTLRGFAPVHAARLRASYSPASRPFGSLQGHVDPKDADHLATALLVIVDQLDTFDEGLIRFTGKLGQPPLVIGYPNVPEQLELLEQSGEL